MQPVATKSNDEKLQEQIRSLAQEVLSEISELEPSRRKPVPDNFEECREAWRDGQMTLRQAAGACGMPHTTFHNAVVRVESSR